jgi:hypothetical protein
MTMRVGGAAKAAAALSVVALATSAGTAVAAAVPENAPPVVSLVMENGKAKLSGAEDLDAGWVTFKASSTKGTHNLWFFTPKPETAPEKATDGIEAMSNVRDNRAKKSEVAQVEKTLVAFGGAAVAPGRPVTFSVNLPEGEVSIGDLAGDAKKAATPIATVMLGDPGGAVRSAGDGNRVSVGSVDGKVQIDAPETMSRKAKLRVTNRDDAKWHFIALNRLNDGAEEKDVLAFYEGNGRSPFDPAHSMLTAPLSGKGEEFLDYDLPAGKYAIVDSWVDSSDGKFYAAKGAIRMVTLQ